MSRMPDGVSVRTQTAMDTPVTTNQAAAPSHPHQTGGLHLPEHLHHLRFPAFKHEHTSEIIDVNKVHDGQLTMGAKISDAVASTVGSWRFIIIQSIILLAWLIVNSLAWAFKWDPYPFILLNLALSFQAAYSAPFVMMSQNRQADKDRLTAQNDYITDVKGEQEIAHMMEHLDHQDTLTLTIVQRLEAQNERLVQQEQLTLNIVQHLEAQNELMKAQHREMLEVLRSLAPAEAERLERLADQ